MGLCHLACLSFSCLSYQEPQGECEVDQASCDVLLDLDVLLHVPLHIIKYVIKGQKPIFRPFLFSHLGNVLFVSVCITVKHLLKKLN